MILKWRTLGISVLMLIMKTAIVFGQSAPLLPDAPSQAPIDGGLSILAAAGFGYAVYKLRKRRSD